MSRGKTNYGRVIAPDPQYNSVLLAKFINFLMLDGKKSVAQRIVYGAFDIINEKTGEEPLAYFQKAVDIVRPQVEVRSRRVGGANYQVPMPVPGRRQDALTFRWLIAAAKGRNEKSMKNRLAAELMDIHEGIGGTMKKKEDVARQAEANKAFAHFARFAR
jgi:small subunit ribosomal protein S7